MQTLKNCSNLEEAIILINEILDKVKILKKEIKLNDKILISNLHHDLDMILHYQASEGRKQD